MTFLTWLTDVKQSFYTVIGIYTLTETSKMALTTFWRLVAYILLRHIAFPLFIAFTGAIENGRF